MLNREDFAVCEPRKETIQSILCETAEALDRMEGAVCEIGVHIYGIQPPTDDKSRPVACLDDAVKDIRERALTVLSMVEDIRDRLV